MKNITQKHIAQKVGVSRTAVSLTLNGHARKYRIKPQTQKKILHFSQELAYSRNVFATWLRTQKSNLIGIIGASYQIPIRQMRQNLIAQYFKNKGFRISMQDFHWSEDRIKLIKEMEELRPEGLIVTEPEPPEVIEYLKTVQKRGLPIVLVDGPIIKELDQVRIDREKVVYLGIKHLLEQGYDEVFLTMPKTFTYWAMQERFRGFTRAYQELRKNGSLNKYLIWNDQKEQHENSFLLGYQIGQKFFSQKNHHSFGIMALNDQVAIGLMKSVIEKNIKIPQNVGLVGSENLPEGEFAPVSLTTIRFPIAELAEKTGEILLQKINGNNKETLIFNLEPELIIKQSSLRNKENEI